MESTPVNLLENVFDSKTKFVNEEGNEILLKDISFDVSEYIYIDLNNDKENELVLYEEKDNSYLVFYENRVEQKVYGFHLDTNSFLNIKTDGSFLRTFGETHNYISKLSFKENRLVFEDLAVLNEDESVYYILGKRTTKALADDFFVTWEETTTHVNWNMVE